MQEGAGWYQITGKPGSPDQNRHITKVPMRSTSPTLLSHCLTLHKKDQDQYLQWRIAPRGARGIQESEIIHKI